jgi:hypothetical protein
MASTYPTTLDSFVTTRNDATVMATNHAGDHDNLADAVNKIELNAPHLVTAETMGITTGGSAAANTTAALAWMTANGVADITILFKQGIYNFDTTAGTPFAGGAQQNMVLRGMGAGNVSTLGGTRLIRNGGSNPLASWTGTGQTGDLRAHGGAHGVEFSGNGAGVGGGDLVVLYKVNEMTFFDARFGSTSSTGIHGTEVWNSRFTNCFFYNCGTSTTSPASLFDGTANAGCNTVQFVGCEWEVCNGTDIMLDSVVGHPTNVILFTGCKWERQVNSATWPVLQIARAYEVTVTGCALTTGGTSTTSPTIQVDGLTTNQTLSLVGCCVAGADTVPYYIIVNGTGNIVCTGNQFLFSGSALVKYIQIASSVAANDVRIGTNSYDAPLKAIEDNRTSGAGQQGTYTLNVIESANNRLDAAATGTYGLWDGGSSLLSSATGGQSVFYFDPSDYPNQTLLRIKGYMLVNSTGLGASNTMQLALVPITTPTGGAATLSVTAGATTSSSNTVTNAAAGSSTVFVSSTDFAMPTAGYYALVLVIGGAAMATNSSAEVRATLQAKSVIA